MLSFYVQKSPSSVNKTNINNIFNHYLTQTIVYLINVKVEPLECSTRYGYLKTGLTALLVIFLISVFNGY